MPLTRAAPSRAELALDRCASTTIGPRRWGSYFVCGLTGYLVGLALVTALALARDLDASARLILALAPPIAFLIAVRATAIVLGHERIVFYEKAIAAVAAAALAAWIAGDPVALVADLAVLGVGTFLAFGRLGCFRVACCHGRPARRGVAYRDEHAEAGFPARWIGVRMFPLQLADGALAGALVVSGAVAILAEARPGTATALFVSGYGLGRFALELVRGDAARPYAGGLSEAQWTAVSTAVLVAAWRPSTWTLACAGALAIAAMALVIARRRGAWTRLWLAGAAHVAEVAVHVDAFAAGATAPQVTREGLRLSGVRLPDGRLDVIVSRPDRPLSERELRALVDQLGRRWEAAEIMAGRTPGLFHVIAARSG